MKKELRKERLQITIMVVGLVASLISIFAFITGAQSVPGLVKKPDPVKPTVIIQNPPVQVPPQQKLNTPGDIVSTPIRHGVNWVGDRFKKPSHQDKPSPDSTAPADANGPTGP